MKFYQKMEFKLKDGVICEMVDQDMILFYTDTNCIINLNRTASIICELLQNKIDFDHLVNDFYNKFQIEGRPSKEIVINDVRGIVEKLNQNGMLLIYKK